MVSGLVYHVAQLNVARAVAPLDDPRLADFMAALYRVNALADGGPTPATFTSKQRFAAPAVAAPAGLADAAR